MQQTSLTQLERAPEQQIPSQQVSPAAQQVVPWLPVQRVWSQGQTLHWLLQQYWPATQQTPSQQVGLVESQQASPCVPPQKLAVGGQGTHLPSTHTCWAGQACP